MKTPLVSKNRAANEFREQAHKLRSELMDPTASFTHEEVEKRTADIRALEMRAQTAAEFTADAEVTRQGGDEGLTRVDVSSERKEFSGMKDATEKVRSVCAEAFPSMGAYIRAATRGPANEKEAAALRSVDLMTRTITGSTNGGEFLLPLTQVPDIFSVSNAQPGLFQYARRYNVPGRTLRIPYLLQDEGTSVLNRPMAGKIANVTIVGEGATKPSREPSFGQRILTMYKYAAITEFGDELLGDDFTGELPAEVTAAVGGQVINKINEDITIDGTGVAMPVGAFNDTSTTGNGALLKVPRDTAGAFKAPDAFAMYERHTHGPNSVWMISRRVLAQLFAMQTSNNTMVSFLPNLRDGVQMQLLGLPVIVTDLLPTLGQQADVALVNGDFYAMGLRQALTVESSIHYKFVNDITTYRFVARAGGIPLPTSTYAYAIDGSGNKVDEHSPFVVLDDATS
jgi:HK97 family phage major capsid protein